MGPIPEELAIPRRRFRVLVDRHHDRLDMVVVGHKLVTHHSVIELVSAPHRERKFLCGPAKAGFSLNERGRMNLPTNST
jgi:hypothetical protein